MTITNSHRATKAAERGAWAQKRGWTEGFTDRQIDEIFFSIEYELDYGHGTDGHNAKSIIAKMAALLDMNDKKLKAEGGPA